MKVVRAGVEVAAAEVCWFRAAEAEHPFRRWFAHGDVRCAAAGSTVELGSGLWNVFAKDARGLSSIPMLLDGDSPPSEATLALEPSAALRIALPETKRAVVYAPLLGVAVPMPSPVPAGQPLWVFVVEKSSPVALFPIAPLEPGTAREVDATGGGPPAVVAWLHVPESDRAMLAKESGLRAPAIHASADGKTSTSDALPRLAGLHGAMVRVPAVAPGNGELRIGGRGWVPQALAIRVEPGLALIDQPLTVRGAGTLIVRWSALSDLPALDASLGACESDPNAPVLELRVSSCPRPRPGEPLDTGGCTIIRQQTFESHLKFGAITVDELPPGLYRAELRYGKLPPVASSTTVGSLQQQAIGLIASYIEIYGSVTYGGEPIGEDAELRFPGGYGFVPGKTSEYRAVLLGILGPETHVAVAACDGAPRETVLTDRQTRPNTRFNIDIPANELVISVTDTFTREPLNDATIRLTAMAVLRPNRPVFTKTVTASGEQGEGRVRIEAVPERLIRLSVASAGYQRQEIEPFTMPRSGTKAVDVQLVPLRGSQGRILSSRTFENASVLWFSEEGYETERAELSADGTFVHARSHDAGERMVVVSQSHPLWVLRPPPVERRQTISLAFPDTAPVRTVEAKLADAEEPNRVAGLVLGGIRVPQPALQQHQALRRDRTTVSGRAPIILRDLVATGPIEILLGPRYEELSSRAAGMDFFALPQFADVPRTTIPAEATVVVLRP